MRYIIAVVLLLLISNIAYSAPIPLGSSFYYSENVIHQGTVWGYLVGEIGNSDDLLWWSLELPTCVEVVCGFPGNYVIIDTIDFYGISWSVPSCFTWGVFSFRTKKYRLEHLTTAYVFNGDYGSTQVKGPSCNTPEPDTVMYMVLGLVLVGITFLVKRKHSS